MIELKPKIMVVDDEPAVGEMLTRFLSQKNYEVTSFTSGKKALEHLKTNPINLMLTDIHMPEMNGAELIKLAKEVRPNLPVIVMTATPDSETAAEITKLGITGYFQKPFNLDYLAGQIKQIFTKSC